jgi:hypothetical protein
MEIYGLKVAASQRQEEDIKRDTDLEIQKLEVELSQAQLEPDVERVLEEPRYTEDCGTQTESEYIKEKPGRCTKDHGIQTEPEHIEIMNSRCTEDSGTQTEPEKTIKEVEDPFYRRYMDERSLRFRFVEELVRHKCGIRTMLRIRGHTSEERTQVGAQGESISELPIFFVETREHCT